MAVIKTDGGYNSLPISYKRGNPIPLDKTSVWYDYDLMQEYARGNGDYGPVAYVGQILGLVDESSNSSRAYIILNTAGDLQEIGASVEIPSYEGDDASIVISEESVALKNWGVQYYKYIPKDGEIEAHYEIQVIDDLHPWVAGLEPKVVLEEGHLVLGWYEPNPTTIEGVNSQLGSLQTTVNDLKQNTYTKAEVDKKVAEAGHLKRIIVDSIDDIDKDAADADQYIYMVLVSPENEADKYDEYMVLAFEDLRYIEKVGSWEVDLSNYVTKNTLTQELANKVDAQEGYALVPESYISKLEGIEAGAQKNLIQGVSSAHFEVDANGLLTFKGVNSSEISGLTTLLDGKVDKEEGKGLSSNDFTNDYVSLVENSAQSVRDLSGQLVIIDQLLNGNKDEEIPGLISIVNGLDQLTQTNSEAIVSINEVLESHGTNLVTLNTDVSTLKTKLETIKLDDYVTKAIFQATVGDLAELQAGQKTLHTQVKELQEALTWGLLDEIIN